MPILFAPIHFLFNRLLNSLLRQASQAHGCQCRCRPNPADWKLPCSALPSPLFLVVGFLPRGHSLGNNLIRPQLFVACSVAANAKALPYPLSLPVLLSIPASSCQIFAATTNVTITRHLHISIPATKEGMQYDVEEDFDLAVAPKRAHFSADSGGASRHLMVNGTGERIAVKVKCSNNHLFRIAPVYTVLEPGCAQRLQVVRDPGSPGTDKLILLYTRTENKNAREVFAECDKSKLRRLLIALVARTELGKEEDNEGEDDDDVSRRNEDAQCGGSDGRAGSPGKASSSATGPPRTETRESIPLIDD